MNTPLPQFILSPDKGLSLHRSGSQIVTMMQATQSWRRGNSCSRFGSAYSHTTVRCSLIQRQMRPVFVVIADIFVHQAPDVTHVDDDHVVEEISAAVANPTLCDAVLPRAPEAGSLGLWSPKLFTVAITSSSKL